MSRPTLSLWNTVMPGRWASQCTSAVTWARGGVSPTRSQRAAEMIAAPLALAKPRKVSGWANRPPLMLSRSAMAESIWTMCWRRPSRCSVRSWASRLSICSESTLPSISQAVRVWKPTPRGCRSWQEISPQSSPRTTMETDMEAWVPMLRMYCRCTGETLRRAAKLRSSGRPVSGFCAGYSGEGV